MSNTKYDDHRLQVFVGNTLKISMYFAMAVAIIGLILNFVQNGNQMVDFNLLKVYHAPTLSPFESFLSGLKSLEPKAIIELGVLWLLATPMIRLLFATYGYLKEKDYLYVAIGLIVIGIICVSIYLGGHE